MKHHFEMPMSAVRQRKEVSLSETTISEVGAFAKENDLSFSRAIEVLASLGLKKKGVEDIALATYLRDVIRGESARHYNRFAKLLVHAGLEAGAAKEAAQQVYFLQLQNLAADADLEAAVGVDPDSPEGKKIITLHNKHKGRFRWRAVQLLKKPLKEMAEILAEISS